MGHLTLVLSDESVLCGASHIDAESGSSTTDISGYSEVSQPQ